MKKKPKKPSPAPKPKSSGSPANRSLAEKSANLRKESHLLSGPQRRKKIVAIRNENAKTPDNRRVRRVVAATSADQIHKSNEEDAKQEPIKLDLGDESIGDDVPFNDHPPALFAMWEVAPSGKKIKITDVDEFKNARAELFDGEAELKKLFPECEIFHFSEPNAKLFQKALLEKMKTMPKLQVLVISAHLQQLGIAPSGSAKAAAVLSYDQLALTLRQGIKLGEVGRHLIWGHCKSMAGVKGLERFLGDEFDYVSGYSGEPTPKEVGDLVLSVLDVLRRQVKILFPTFNVPRNELDAQMDVALAKCRQLAIKSLTGTVKSDPKAGKIVLSIRNRDTGKWERYPQ